MYLIGDDDMKCGRFWLIVLALVALDGACAGGAEWWVAPDGTPGGRGTQSSPWSLEAALAGPPQAAPGDTIWIGAGTYRSADRSLGSPGYTVRLAGRKERPVCVRGVPGRRVTIDGGLSVQAPSTWLWIRDLEMVVSENLSMSRALDEPGSHPESYNRPWGGLHVHSGEGCKFINLVIHDNAQGISWWSGSTQSEVYGCIIYDNGWKAPDRGHGHAIYTQNREGLKTIADCIMTGGYGYTMHAYGSSQAYVDHYLVEGNVAYRGGPFLIGGGRPSRDIRVIDNCLYDVSLQLGYSAPENEDCEVRGNVILGGGLSINRFKQVAEKDNLVIPPKAAMPAERPPLVVLRPNRYDADRAHLAVFNWSKAPAVEVDVSGWLRPGDRFRLQSPRDLFGEPVFTGVCQGKSIRVPLDGEFACFVVLRGRG